MALRPRIEGFAIERQAPTRARPTAAFLIFERVDVMDVMGPLSVFEHAGFEVFTFAQTDEPVDVGLHLVLQPDYTVETLPDVDVLVLPGSGLAESNPGDEQIVAFLRARAPETEVVFSVCSGAFFLAEAGLLDGQQATTFAALIPRLSENYPKAEVVDDRRYTDNGRIVTSSGLSSGIDAAFAVVAKFRGEGRAQDLANHMEYRWTRADGFARSQLADRFLAGIRELLALFSTDYLDSSGDLAEWKVRYALTDQLEADSILTAILGRLEASDRWTTGTSGPRRIAGHLTHPSLGRARIELAVQDENGRAIATLSANREAD